MKISIVTPSYNQAPFILRTMDSVLNQKGDFQLEYILIDGASTDASPQLIRDRIQKIPPHAHIACRFVSEPDEGQSDAINKGLQMATGDIVAYLNSDDLYEPGALQRVAQFFAQHPHARFATGYCRIIDENDREIRQWITRYKNRSLRRVSFRRLLVENCISQPATFWRKSILHEIGPFDKNQYMVMDYDMWCRIAAHHKIHLIPQYLAAFRWYATSKSGAHYSRQFRDQYRVACRYLPPASPLRIIHWLNVQKILWTYRIMNILRRAAP